MFVGWFGRVYDSRVFGRFRIGKMIIEGILIFDDLNLVRVIDNYIIELFFIGDLVYSFFKYVMKNYLGSNFISEKEYFNYRFSRVRI